MLNSPSHGGLPTCAVKKAVQRYKYYSKQQKVLRKNTHLSLLQIYTEQTYCMHKYIIHELFFAKRLVDTILLNRIFKTRYLC